MSCHLPQVYLPSNFCLKRGRDVFFPSQIDEKPLANFGALNDTGGRSSK
jgi:hypothetical protein